MFDPDDPFFKNPFDMDDLNSTINSIVVTGKDLSDPFGQNLTNTVNFINSTNLASTATRMRH